MFEKYIKQTGLDSLRDTNDRYFIDPNGVIKGIDGFDLPQSLDVEGFPQVFAKLWDGPKFYRVVDLMAIHFKNIKLPQQLWNKVEGFYIDQDVNNQHASNIGYRFRDGPLECLEHPNFYYVPMFTQYGISRDGVIVNSRNGLIRTGWCRTPPEPKKRITGGYWTNSAVFDVGGRRTVLRHRLLCLTFKPYPNHVDRLDVNHKDGIPGNDGLDNLEWVTRSRNLTHAYQNNLRTQNRPLLVRKLRTGEVSEFISAGEAAKATGVLDGTIAWRLAKGCLGVNRDGYQFKYFDDPRDWVEYEDLETAIAEAIQAKAIWVRNCRTGSVMRYESISEAGKSLGFNGSTIAARLIKGLDDPHRGYQFKYTDDDTEWAEFDPECLDDTGNIARKVLGRNLVTGETCVYSSISECIRKQNASEHLAEALRQGQQPTYPDGWQYRYEGEVWVASTGPGNRARGIKARHVLTGVVVYARSVRELGTLLNMNHQTLGKAADSNGTLVVGLFQCMWGMVTEWPVLLATDLQALRSGESFRGEYSVLTDHRTGEQHYFASAEACVDFLDTVNSKPVLYRLVRAGKLLDDRYLYSKYLLKCHLKR